jgi:hypothetical protein
MMRDDPEPTRACRAAHLTVADGMSVVWALRASGQPVPERVAGIDLMVRLLSAAAEHRLRVYFLGARRDVVTALVETTRVRHPGIEIAAFRDGYFGSHNHRGIVEEIRASAPRCCFLVCPPRSRRPGARAIGNASRCPSSWALVAASRCWPASSGVLLAGRSHWGWNGSGGS